MPKKGSGRMTHAEWKRPTEAMRKRPHRKMTLSDELHRRLDELPVGSVSAHTEAALREWLYMEQLDDAPPRPAKAE